ncbi:MAG: MMPL family transporter [Candidatus Methylacidiphilales bacterium]
MKGSLHTLTKSGLEKLAVFIEAHPWKVVVLSSVLVLVMGWLAATRLGVLNNVNDLVKSDAEVHRHYLDYRKEFGVREEIVVVVKSKDFSRNREAAEVLAARFAARPQHFDRVYYRHDFSAMENRMLHYAPMEELESIRDKLKGYREAFKGGSKGMDLNSMLDEAVGRFDEKTLRSKQGWSNFKPFIDDFIGNLDQLADQLSLEIRTSKTQVSALGTDRLAEMRRMLYENEYLTVNQGEMVLLLLTPTAGEPQSFSPFQNIIHSVREDVREVRLLFPDLEMGVTGEPVLLDDELTQSTRDSAKAAVITFVLISLLFFAAYREWVRPALAIVALLFSIGWTMGLTTLTIGHLNIISQACVIMLLGLGIDFGIQILGRYEEERKKGSSIDDAVVQTLRHTGVAVLTGGSTTAVAFFTMCFNEFIGLAELGIISGMGILLSVMANLVFLPAMLVLRDKWLENKKNTKQLLPKQPTLRRELDTLLFSRPRMVLTLAGLFTLLAGWSARSVGFDFNLLNLQNPELESVQYELKLVNSSSSGTIFGVIVADNIEQARELKSALKQKSTVAGVRTLEDLLPEDWEKKPEILAEIKRELSRLNMRFNFGAAVNVAQARAQLQSLLSASREAKAEAEKYRVRAKLVGKGSEVAEAIDIFGRLIPPLERAVESLTGLNDAEAGNRLNRYQVETLGRMQKELEWLRRQDFERSVNLDDLPKPLLNRYLSPQGKVLLEVDPKENVWEEEPNKRFVADLRSVAPWATGTPVQNLAYINLLRDSYVEASVWAALAMVILIYGHFRSLSKVVLTMVPLALGIVWTGGVMAWFGILFNPANIITLPLVIGIGVAFGVYVVDRHREDGAVHLFGSSTGKAILLSALTTIIGFGSMMTGEYVGLRSLGLVMTLGIIFCFLTSVLVLPQILVLMDGLKKSKLP